MEKRAQKLWKKTLLEQKNYDVGIVPGYPYNGGSWDPIMEARVRWAIFLYQKGIVRNLIFSGGAVHSPYVEAKIMGLYAEQLGVDTNHIFYETKAEHSTENIYYSYLLAGQNGFKSVALLTDPFQSALLARFTKKRFMTPIAHIPFIEDSLRLITQKVQQINSENAMQASFIPLKDRESGWKRIKGTFGSNIPWGARKKLPAL